MTFKRIYEDDDLFWNFRYYHKTEFMNSSEKYSVKFLNEKLKLYNTTIIQSGPGVDWFLDFETEEDYINFILKYNDKNT